MKKLQILKESANGATLQKLADERIEQYTEDCRER